MSEVVTNAVVHSDSGTDPGGLVTVGVGMRADLVYIEVIDQGSAFNVPAMRSADEDSLSGRGLSWVNHLSARWGSDHASEIGRAVWFEVQI